MNKYVKTFLGIIVILVPLILILGLFFSKLTKKSFYEESGFENIPGLRAEVKVYTDENGVRHIAASNEDDLYLVLGFIHAKDRLWQMDISRRVAEGRLSEIWGSAVLDYDCLFRTIGIDKFAYRLHENVSPKTKEILGSYTKGINKFIELYSDKLPIEFDLLNYKPEPWKPQESLMIARLMAWDLNTNWFTDYALGEIIEKTGLEKASYIFPDSNITIFKKPKEDTTSAPSPLSEGEGENSPHFTYSGKNRISPLLRRGAGGEVLASDFYHDFLSFREFFGITSTHTGSNSWVISSERSESGKPIMANDPHLGFQAPSKWHEVHLKAPEIDAYGMSVPGIPGVIIGHNRNISWGLTNLMNDDNDFILMDKDSISSAKYKFKNKLYDMDSSLEKINVKDSEVVSYVVKNTIEGPVISDLRLRSFSGNPSGGSYHKNKILTLKWTGFEYSDEISAFYKLNRAKSWEDFTNALKDFGAPAQNFIYADISGNIGYHAGGKIPVRKNTGNEYLYPFSDVEWSGFIDFDKLPNTYNPKEGFIITANTNPFDWLKTDTKNSYYISYSWEPSSRFQQIHRFIESKSLLGTDEFKIMQMSYRSPYAEELKTYLINAFKESKSTQENSQALEILRNWNCNLKPEDPAVSIYSVFLVYLIKNIYADELGETIFHDFLLAGNFPCRSLMVLLEHSNSLPLEMSGNDNPPLGTGCLWFDNIATSAVETRDEIIRESFEQAVNFLKEKFQDANPQSWHWGMLHKLKFNHPLGSVPALDNTFNIGTFEIGGDQTTVNNGEYSLNKALYNGDFSNNVGPSMRMITDLSDISHSLSVNSTGQSGQPLHQNYQDQTRMWLYGDYKKDVMDEFEMLSNGYKVLILSP